MVNIILTLLSELHDIDIRQSVQILLEVLGRVARFLRGGLEHQQESFQGLRERLVTKVGTGDRLRGHLQQKEVVVILHFTAYY